MPVEEAELLLPMGGIVGRIQVDRDAAGPAPEPRPMVLDDQIGQPDARQIERLPPDGVLEPGERRLGGQVGAGERIALEQELVHRVVRPAARRRCSRRSRRRSRRRAAAPTRSARGRSCRAAAVAQAAGQPLGQPEPVVERP